MARRFVVATLFVLYADLVWRCYVWDYPLTFVVLTGGKWRRSLLSPAVYLCPRVLVTDGAPEGRKPIAQGVSPGKPPAMNHALKGRDRTALADAINVAGHVPSPGATPLGAR